jgi:mono/diheme cytochrome c family protein
MRRRGAGGLAPLTIAAALAAGWSAQADDAPKAGDGGSAAARVAQGKALYDHHCSHCHGFGMVTSGNVAPDLREFSGDEMRFVDTVTHGKNNRMPSWGDMLSPVEIRQLWAYIHSNRQP